MPRHETRTEERRRRDLEALLAAIQNGEVDAFEDLDAHEVALLMERHRDGETLEDLFDRLRAGDPERT